MRITVRVVPSALCEELSLALARDAEGRLTWVCTSNHENAFVFPCESFAQAAIDGFMAQRSLRSWYLDIQDDDDAERGSLEPIWTGPVLRRYEQEL